jgi:hypothetical protein
MLQTSVAAPALTRHQPETQEADLLDPLWRLAGNRPDLRTLIVAEHGLDLLCGLIRRGCLAATVLRLGDKPDNKDYDLLIVPQIAALPSPDAVIRLARRALAANGRLIVGTQGQREAAALARRLRLNGFSAIHTTHMQSATILRADLRRPS